ACPPSDRPSLTEYQDLRQTNALIAVGAYQSRISNFCQSSASSSLLQRCPAYPVWIGGTHSSKIVLIKVNFGGSVASLLFSRSYPNVRTIVVPTFRQE
ncbi:hypothetical protein, partial [Novosphingobium resinovorum]|uniref:hypothetical protein n=1 Tax=Novosphingobium resinovorum TaxID=158500 RepID=UPI002ED69DEA|nr:hypothetical protein [Novosphingobium resinovorum]